MLSISVEEYLLCAYIGTMGGMCIIHVLALRDAIKEKNQKVLEYYTFKKCVVITIFWPVFVFEMIVKLFKEN